MTHSTPPLAGLCGLVFDCDGVLMDSKASNTRFYNMLRSLLGLPPMSEKDACSAHMLTYDQAVELVIPAALRPRLYEVAAHVNYNRDVLPLLRPSEGLKNCLDALRGRGLQLGVCTNRSESMYLLIDQFGLSGYFSEVMTAVDVRPKPDPDGLQRILAAWNCTGRELVFLGDSSIDEAAARNAGVRFWAFDAPGLTAERHIRSFAQLQELALPPEL
jgi:HAD superfamily hydrolase (TIGR01509 family)